MITFPFREIRNEIPLEEELELEPKDGRDALEEEARLPDLFEIPPELDA